MLKIRKFYYILSGGVCALAILLTIFYCSAIPIAHADSNVSLSVDNSDVVLELTVPSSAALNLTPSSANGGISYSERNIDVSAGTNNIAGYTLTMRANSSALTRTNSITDGGGATSIPTIPSVSGSYALNDYHTAQATINTWACALPDPEEPNATLSYTSVPTTDTRIAFTETAGNANTTTVSFTAKVDSSLPAGTYATTLNFVAVANTPVPSVLYMQNVNEWGSTLATDESVQVVDNRDDKTYWVTKLADGNIWMTQNLDLGSTSKSITLTSDDTNLATGATYTLPTATSLSVAFTDESKSLLERLNVGNKAYAVVPPPMPEETPAGVVDHGEVYIIGSNTYSALDSCKNAVGGDNAEEVCEHSTIGNHYDWSVATAGSGDSMSTSYTNAPYSICPKGWRLPMGYDGTNGEFKTLNSLYNNSSTSSDAGLIDSPLFFVRAGDVLIGSLYGVGSSGDYWSSTVYGSDSAYSLGFRSSDVYPTYGLPRIIGNSVRCVAE